MDDTKLGWRLPRAFWRATGRYFEEPVLNPFGGHSPIGLRCDIDPACKPHVLCDALRLPFAAESFATVIFDPPYNLTNIDRRAHHLDTAIGQALMCLRAGGHMLYIHTVCPRTYKHIPIIATHFLAGTWNHVRIVCVFRKHKHIQFDEKGRTGNYRQVRRKGIMQAQLYDGRKKSERQNSFNFSLDNSSET